ncbi:MAG: phospholipase D-like domain-containing protein, partial [Betaproteobacteria bacterium]
MRTFEILRHPSRVDALMRRFAMVVVALVALAGCGTMLPTIVPDMADARTVRLEGPNGLLSAEQSKAILDRLKSRGGQTSIFDRHLAIEEGVAGSPLVIGNNVVLLQDGPATYGAMLTAIRGARQHVHMESYIFDDDEVGNRFADLLIEKRRQGVQVALIYDSVGAIDASKGFFQHLADNGVSVLEFNPINPLAARKGWQVNQRDHRKLLIVDGRAAFVGGINISGVYSTGSFGGGSRPAHPDGQSAPWRDTHVQIEGPVVAEFQKLFLGTWEKQQGKPLPARDFFPQPAARGKEVVRAIGSSPDRPYSVIYATLISAIKSAETSVCLTNAYFVPDPQLQDALE